MTPSEAATINGLTRIIKMWCGFNPFYIMPDAPPFEIHIMAHNKVLKHLKKRFKYWGDHLPAGVMVKFFHTSHRKNRILRENGLGYEDFRRDI